LQIEYQEKLPITPKNNLTSHLLWNKGKRSEVFPVGYLKGVQFYDLFATGKEQEKEFYRQMAQKIGSPALELGVGTGIFAFILAEDGIEVVGIDNSPHMLNEARKKLHQASPIIVNRLSFIEADMVNFQLDQCFRLIYIPSTSFQHLDTPEKQRSCLTQIKKHLHPTGRFVFDVWTGYPESTGLWRRLETVSLPEGGAVTRSMSTRVLEAHGVIDTVLRFDVHDRKGSLQKTYLDWSQLAILSVKRMRQLLEETGFQIEVIYSSFNLNSWKLNDEHAIFLTRKTTS